MNTCKGWKKTRCMWPAGQDMGMTWILTEPWPVVIRTWTERRVKNRAPPVLTTLKRKEAAIRTTARPWRGTADVPGAPVAATVTAKAGAKIASKKKKSDHNQSLTNPIAVYICLVRCTLYPYSFNIPSHFWVIECCQQSSIIHLTFSNFNSDFLLYIIPNTLQTYTQSSIPTINTFLLKPLSS